MPKLPISADKFTVYDHRNGVIPFHLLESVITTYMLQREFHLRIEVGVGTRIGGKLVSEISIVRFTYTLAWRFFRELSKILLLTSSGAQETPRCQ